MLWDVDENASKANAVADENATDTRSNDKFYVQPNFYVGPYTGPTHARRFLVVKEGIRSSYCL